MSTRMPRLLALLAIGAIGYLQWQQAQLAEKEARISSDIAQLQQANSAQRAENNRLNARVALIKETPDIVFEALARQKLFMIKPNEIYVLPLAEEKH